MSDPWLITRRGARHLVEYQPSGCEIAQFASRKAPKNFITAIGAIADWHKTIPASDPAVLAAVHRAALTSRGG